MIRLTAGRVLCGNKCTAQQTGHTVQQAQSVRTAQVVLDVGQQQSVGAAIVPARNHYYMNVCKLWRCAIGYNEVLSRGP